MSFFRVNENCNGCLACVQNCPATALDYVDERDQRRLLHNMALCARCGQCWRVCPQDAVEFQHLLQSEWDEVVSLRLVRCQVCQEPIFASAFEKTLEEKTVTDIAHLCPKHRQRTAADMWPNLVPGKSRVNKVKH